MRSVLEKRSFGKFGCTIFGIQFASLLLQQGESIIYVKEQLSHASIQITVDTYGHLLPSANRVAVDRLDDAPAQLDATQAQPTTLASAASDQPTLFVKNGEPHFRELEPLVLLAATG